MNKYITIKRFKQAAIAGSVNIPAQTECFETNNMIIVDNKPICFATSENGHTYFAINNDGKGKERGKLIQQIKDLLVKRSLPNSYGPEPEPDIEYNKCVDARWDAIWESDLCKPFKRKEFADHWLWNHDFYLADINTLTSISKLISNINKGE